MQRMIDSAMQGITTGADDIRFVLGKLAELNKSGADRFPLAERLDLNRIAAMGHSAGGAFAARACQLDARIRACVSLDGELPPVAAFPEYPDGKRMQQPVLLLEVDQTGKRRPFSEAQFADYQRKEEAQLNQCPPGSYRVLLNVPGLFHGSFSDYPLRAANGDATKTAQALHNLRLTESLARAFLDKVLKGEKAPLLDEPSLSTEAKVTKYPR
jgi:predicted dienelactone hydrolase